MQCTFCGTENRPEYKFCGMCGVRMERRQADRRVQQGGASQKCSSCGHLSEPGLKFCGMCGARVERRVQERRGSEGQIRAAAIANAQLPTPEASRPMRVERPVAVGQNVVDVPPPGIRRGEPAIFQTESQRSDARRNGPALSSVATSRDEAVNGSQISGPSFLGLNSQPDNSGEYLLEDEPSGSGLRKVLLLVILAAILGLIFMQWRSSFKASPKAAPAKAEPASTPAGENLAPATPASDPAAKNANASAKATDDPSSSSAKDSVKDDAAKATEEPVAAVIPNGDATVPAPEEASASDNSPDTHKPAAETKPAPETHLPDSKPSAALVRAQQYLQGRGVPQSCEQGLIYLKAATDKADPGAAIQMAALYASGHCVKQDRVMAYRWFNSAHELEPANMWIQKNMDQLWSQMSEQERRLAGY
jgi:Double zinc ribbon